MRPLVPLAAIVVLLSNPGCCSLARLFCGPDRSPWVSIDFSTPRLAVQTMLEAFRRDDPEVVYLCLSNDFRRRLGVDSQTTIYAWPKIREQNPGLHLAGYATVPTPTRFGLDRARVVLDIEGRAVEIELIRQSYTGVRYVRPGAADDQAPADVGVPIDSLVGFAEIEVVADPDRDLSRITVAPLTFEHFGSDEVPLENIEFAGLERRWKIAALRLLEN